MSDIDVKMSDIIQELCILPPRVCRNVNKNHLRTCSLQNFELKAWECNFDQAVIAISACYILLIIILLCVWCIMYVHAFQTEAVIVWHTVMFGRHLQFSESPKSEKLYTQCSSKGSRQKCIITL